MNYHLWTGLKPKYKSIITTTRGQAIEPSLIDMENLIVNEEDLDKTTSNRPTNNEETTFFH